MSRIILSFLLARLKEPSTWKGIFMTMGALGLAVSPELGAALTILGCALAGGTNLVLPDKVLYQQRPDGIRTRDTDVGVVVDGTKVVAAERIGSDNYTLPNEPSNTPDSQNSGFNDK